MGYLKCIMVYLILNFLRAESFAVNFYLKANSERCLTNFAPKNLQVKGDYRISEDPSQRVHIKVVDSKNHLFYSREDAKGNGTFSIISDNHDKITICFTSEMRGGGIGADMEIYLHLKLGVEANNYDEVANVEKLRPMELQLKRMEDLSESIVKEFYAMRERKEDSRDTNDSTHSRIVFFSAFSALCLLSLTTWQVMYLKRYFKLKKLIE